jgi:ethanolamine-phosphate cytidylyltransferase
VYNSDGVDICATFSKIGRFKVFKRTEGVSTTDIVGKLLLLTKDTSVGRGRARSGSLEKPMTTSEYVDGVRNIQMEEVKNENSTASPYQSITQSLAPSSIQAS